MESTTQVQSVVEQKKQEAFQFAQEKFTQLPDWLTFFKWTLGIDGKVRELFPSQEEFVEFERTPEYSQIQQMVAALRAMKRNPSLNQEPTRVITVRLPKTVHEALRAEANDHDISMNWLCIAKLIQAFDDKDLPIPPTHASHSKVTQRSRIAPQRETMPPARNNTPGYATQPTGSEPRTDQPSGAYQPYSNNSFGNSGF